MYNKLLENSLQSVIYVINYKLLFYGRKLCNIFAACF